MPSEQSPSRRLPDATVDGDGDRDGDRDGDGDGGGDGGRDGGRSEGRRRPWRYGELTRDDIVEAALRLCRHEGLAHLTMRKLAAELGLSSMNAYYYVSSKGELSDLVADAVLGRIPEPPPGLDRWDDKVVFLFREGRNRLLEYPGVSDHLLVRATGHPNELRLHRILDGVLVGAGFSPAASGRIQRVLTYLLFGAVSQELATAGAAERDRTLTFSDDADVFDFGLAVMLDGLRARLPGG